MNDWMVNEWKTNCTDISIQDMITEMFNPLNFHIFIWKKDFESASP